MVEKSSVQNYSVVYSTKDMNDFNLKLGVSAMWAALNEDGQRNAETMRGRTKKSSGI